MKFNMITTTLMCPASTQPCEVGKWVPVYLLGVKLWKHRGGGGGGVSGALPSPVAEANESAAQFDFLEHLPNICYELRRGLFVIRYDFRRELFVIRIEKGVIAIRIEMGVICYTNWDGGYLLYKLRRGLFVS